MPFELAWQNVASISKVNLPEILSPTQPVIEVMLHVKIFCQVRHKPYLVWRRHHADYHKLFHLAKSDIDSLIHIIKKLLLIHMTNAQIIKVILSLLEETLLVHSTT